MKNKRLFPLIILILSIIFALHLIGIFAGLYDKGVSIDIPQHILGGVIFSLVWIEFAKIQLKNSSKLFIFVSVLSVAVLGSFIWEILEFIVWKSFPDFANAFKFYSPTVSESLSDMFGGFIGGFLVALFTILKRNSSSK